MQIESAQSKPNVQFYDIGLEIRSLYTLILKTGFEVEEFGPVVLDPTADGKTQLSVPVEVGHASKVELTHNWKAHGS